MHHHRAARIAMNLSAVIGTFALVLCTVTGAAAASIAPALVTAQPQQHDVVAGKPVTVDFVARAPYTIASCSVASNPPSNCTMAQPQRSTTASVIIPASTAPGSLTLTWSARLLYTGKQHSLTTPAHGQFTLMVHPPEPHFTVTADRESGPPGTPVTVSFTTRDRVTIRTCNARFAGQKDTKCGAQSGQLSAIVRVPADARPGTITIEWDLVYAPAFPDHTGFVPGTIPFRVPAPPTGPTTPPTVTPSFPRGGTSYSVIADTTTSAPGQALHVWFRPLNPNVQIVDCAAGLGQRTPVDCTTGSRDRSIELRPALDEEAGSLPIHWTLSYSIDGNPSHQESGVLPLTVLAPAQADNTSWFTDLGSVPGVLAAVLAAAAVLALSTRRQAARNRANHNENRGHGAVARTRAGVPRVSVHDVGGRPTRIVHIAVRVPAAITTINNPDDSR